MWHHRGGFRGGWVFWIILIMFFSGFMGKAGIPGFVIPLFIFWMVMSAFSGAKRTEPRLRRPRYQPEAPSAARQPSPEPDAIRRPAPSMVVDTDTRSLTGLPGHCKSCGGPVDETTVRWRGSYPACGFCGTGLRDQG